MSLDLKSLSNDISNINGSINTINNNINTTNTTISNSDKIYTTTNSGNAYSVSIPSVTALSDGLQRKIKFNADSTGNCTLNMSSLGTKAIRNGSGDQITDLKKNQNCIVVYNSSNDSFILLGKGGDLNNDDRLALITIANNAESYNSTTKSTIINSVNTSLNTTLSADSTWNQIKSAIDNGSNFKYGSTTIVGSSHPTTNAPIDLASIRLELYSRLFPDDLSKIQIIKNNSDNVFGGANIKTDPTGNATDEESIYLTLNENMYPDTDYKVVLTKGSIKDKLNNDFNELEYSFHTNPNPSVWVNNPNELNVGRRELAGCGSQSSALAFGGYGSSGYYLASTEKFNGSTWSTTGNLNTGRYQLAGCGSQSSALSFGGNGSSGYYLATTEKFNGSTWSTTGNLLYGRNSHAGCGEQSSALAFGGYCTSYSSSSTEKFNGSTWSSTGDMITARHTLAGCGEQNSALSFCGTNYKAGGTYILSSSTEKFNGTAWSSTGDMITARHSLAGCGTQSSALAFGGYNGSSGYYLASTEKFNGSTWSSTGNLITGRHLLAGCGEQSSALAFGGVGDNTSYLASTEKFFG